MRPEQIEKNIFELSTVFLVVKKKRTTNEILEAALKNGGQISSFKIISDGN